jgi:McrBC 5-methylcytosine restriction system component
MLRLEVYLQNRPVTGVAEYSEVEIRLVNPTSQVFQDLKVYLQSYQVRKLTALAANSVYTFSYNVRDYVGEIAFDLTYQGQNGFERSNPVTITVQPEKLSLDELYFIKFNRLPTVLARLNAPNGIRLRYDEPPLQPHFDFYSPEYTAEKLLYFSRQFLDKGLAERILERLDYATPEQLESGMGEVRGAINWQITLREWFNRPSETHLTHYWKTSPKFFLTLPNLVFLKFQESLVTHLGSVISEFNRFPTTRNQYKELKNDLFERMNKHLVIRESPEFSPKPRSKDIRLYEIDKEFIEYTIQNTQNPNYLKMWELWQDFNARFVSIPKLENQFLAFSGLQPMSKIYELWAVCEVAAGLNLEYVPTPRKGLELLASADFKGELGGKPVSLSYNQGVREGWYSATRTGTPRPDILLEWGDKRILLDVKYRIDDNGRANSEDVYKMLAYMNDLGINTGGIIYPGDTALRLATDRKGQNLAEIALRPPVSSPVNDFSANLHQIISSLLA